MSSARSLIVLATTLLFAQAGSAASFDCANARSNAEKAICADPVLSELDEHLGRPDVRASVSIAERL